ncbi:hypothetical protein KJY78_06005 [Canibacter sp. lx-45]|uniref:hypothetical protein n=1 Tax=Canibacter zhuwentaonis TaxID=2837491 RepID=UPI001BDBF593|nr:hypothetical protein [Canibacter zhuwentaonis]MBT1035896.1 hypothetical protein [Canibacter zhuwentaonis]
MADNDRFDVRIPETPFEADELQLSNFDLKLQQTLNYNPKRRTKRRAKWIGMTI